MCLPREVSYVPDIAAEGRVTGPDRIGEVSRGHSSRWKRAPQKRGGLTPVKARTVPGPNGTGKFIRNGVSFSLTRSAI